MTVQVQEAVAKQAQGQRALLAVGMSPRELAVCEDETFHPDVCLVASKPVSNFILVEQYAPDRTAATWAQALDTALDGLPVTVIQGTSDEAKALRHHQEQDLGAQHASDLFHGQHEVSKGTRLHLDRQARQANAAVVAAQMPVDAGRAAQRAYDAQVPSSARPTTSLRGPDRRRPDRTDRGRSRTDPGTTGAGCRHSAMSYGHAEALEAHLRAEVQVLLALAERTDGAQVPDGMSIPAELERREERLAAIAAAKIKIAAWAAERFAREQAEYEATLAARAARVAATGKKLGGTVPKAPTPGPRVDDQINLTDDASRIIPVAGGSFEQCYNAQAMVDPKCMLVVVPKVVQAVNDKQQVLPMLAQLQALPAGLNGVKRLAADAGYFSKDNVTACDAAGIEPLSAVTRDQHHPHWSERFREPPELAPAATPVERMTNRLKTAAGRAAYVLRKQTVEPVFEIIQSVMGFRQFLTRGLDNVQGEWTLICLA